MNQKKIIVHTLLSDINCQVTLIIKDSKKYSIEQQQVSSIEGRVLSLSEIQRNIIKSPV